MSPRLCRVSRAHRLHHFLENEERAMGYKFEIYKDKAGEFRFRFRAPNGEKMFASEGYANKASAKSTIKSNSSPGGGPQCPVTACRRSGSRVANQAS